MGRIQKYYHLLRHSLTTPAMVSASVADHADGWVDLYYKDAIRLPYDVSEVDDPAWQVKNNCLSLRNPDRLDRCCYSLKLTFQGNEMVYGKYPMPVCTHYFINVRVRTWHNDAYRLTRCSSDWFAPQYVQDFGEYELLLIHNTLYCREKGKHLEKMCKCCIQFDEGFEIRAINGWYAIRNGHAILVSKGLKGPWKEIFRSEDTCGLGWSMEFVAGEQGKSELLFSEYSTSWGRHHIYAYIAEDDRLETRQTFYSIDEHNQQGLAPFARHTHVLMRDPYTGDIYIGNGDYNDGSSAIYVSHDNCRTLIRLGAYSQDYRTLSFVFTEQSVFWTMDTPYDPQYICRLSRKDLPSADQDASPITKFPLIQSAHWHILPLQMENGEPMLVLSTNREACFYDHRIHTFGVRIVDECPAFYDLLALPYSGNIFHQYCPMGVSQNRILLMDNVTRKRAFYKITKI